MARKPDPTQGAAEFVIFIMLVIPIGIYFLCKWSIKGIAAVCNAISSLSQKKSKSVYPAYQPITAPPKSAHGSSKPIQSRTVHNLQSYPKETGIGENRTKREIKKKGAFDMAIKLGAGKYVFGENIPLGTYDLKVISGEGTLTMQKLKGTEWEEDWFDFGKDEGYIKSYHGLSLPQGKWFEVEGDVIFEISRAKMLDID